jgi:hypothetical protein
MSTAARRDVFDGADRQRFQLYALELEHIRLLEKQAALGVSSHRINRSNVMYLSQTGYN